LVDLIIRIERVSIILRIIGLVCSLALTQTAFALWIAIWNVPPNL
jgi:hypothetical protein